MRRRIRSPEAHDVRSGADRKYNTRRLRGVMGLHARIAYGNPYLPIPQYGIGRSLFLYMRAVFSQGFGDGLPPVSKAEVRR
jgi:hypothetical protein